MGDAMARIWNDAVVELTLLGLVTRSLDFLNSELGNLDIGQSLRELCLRFLAL
jgi:hypothetical protein